MTDTLAIVDSAQRLRLFTVDGTTLTEVASLRVSTVDPNELAQIVATLKAMTGSANGHKPARRASGSTYANGRQKHGSGTLRAVMAVKEHPERTLDEHLEAWGVPVGGENYRERDRLRKHFWNAVATGRLERAGEGYKLTPKGEAYAADPRASKPGPKLAGESSPRAEMLPVILSALAAQNETLSTKELAKRTGFDHQKTGVQLNSYAKAGYVEQDSALSGPKAAFWRITEAGTARLTAALQETGAKS